MTTEQHLELLTELRAIREALEKPKPAPMLSLTAATARTPTPDTLPLPVFAIADAGSVQVHFGKNAGVPLSALSDKQLLWYGADRPEQLKKDGTPFAPREADVLLKNACRTLWHQRKSGAPLVTASKTSELASEGAGEEVPF
jgi:hypothetical protein